jgi:PAP2 superfamily
MVFAPSHPRRRDVEVREDGLDLAANPDRRSKWWFEILVIVFLCWVYDAVTNLPPVRNVAARDHARSVLHLEQTLHLDPEAALNSWLAGHHTLGLWAGDYYDNAHFVVTLGVVGWLWWRHPRQYRPLRNGLVLCNLIAFVVFWLYPMAPPRMLPGGHYVDIVAVSGAFGSAHSGTLATVANELAAMPSLHIAWAVWSAWAVFVVLRQRSTTPDLDLELPKANQPSPPGWRKWLWLLWAYPVLTGVIVLSTGNHFLADVLAGALTAVLAIGLGYGLAARWPGWRAQIIELPRRALTTRRPDAAAGTGRSLS